MRESPCANLPPWKGNTKEGGGRGGGDGRRVSSRARRVSASDKLRETACLFVGEGCRAVLGRRRALAGGQSRASWSRVKETALSFLRGQVRGWLCKEDVSLRIGSRMCGWGGADPAACTAAWSYALFRCDVWRFSCRVSLRRAPAVSRVVVGALGSTLLLSV